MSRRVGPHKTRSQSSQNFQPRIIFYDREQKLEQKCRICSYPSNLISVCDCNFKYHEKCLLNYIRLQMKKALTTQLVFNAATIKCPGRNCQRQIHFIHEERYRYGFQFFCQKLGENKCNKHLVLILVLLLIMGAFAFVAYTMSSSFEQTVQFVLFCVFSMLSLVAALSVVSVLIVCCSKYLQIRQIFLKSIVRAKIRQSEGGSSSSSDENKMYENISENFQIYVQD